VVDLSSGAVGTINADTYFVSSLAFSPGGEYLATGGHDKAIRLWNPASGICLQVMQGHGHDILSLAFSPGGEYLASGSMEPVIKLWDPSTGRLMRSWPSEYMRVSSLVFSPDGKHLASVTWDHLIRLWNPVSGTCTMTMKGYPEIYTSSVALAFFPGGKSLVSGCSLNAGFEGGKGILKIWELSRGTCANVVPGLSPGVRSIACFPDNKRLITGNQDGTIRWWDGSSGECTKIMDTHSSLSSIALSPMGNFIASGSGDGTVKFWDPHTGAFLASLIVFKDNNWLALSPGGLVDGTPGGLDHLRWVVGLKTYKLDAMKVPGTSIYPGLLKGIFARAQTKDGPSISPGPDNR